ncbi:MAG: hypothetical protein NT034_04525 [Candidatus Magasanikbacteria bacterium]|nr:hypothetical protein [Candidatus Magasanikbacteria bacterium]
MGVEIWDRNSNDWYSVEDAQAIIRKRILDNGISDKLPDADEPEIN